MKLLPTTPVIVGLGIVSGITAAPLLEHDHAVRAADTATYCPAAGTVAKGRNRQGDATITSKGHDPADSAICVRISEGPGAGVVNGKENRTLFGWYSLTTRKLTDETQQRIRDDLGAILAGRRDHAEFEVTMSLPGTARVWTSTETWTRTGQATLPIGGQSVRTITYHHTEVGGAGASYNNEWDLWYEPARHMWVKGELRSPGGPVRDSFEAISISDP